MCSPYVRVQQSGLWNGSKHTLGRTLSLNSSINSSSPGTTIATALWYGLWYAMQAGSGSGPLSLSPQSSCMGGEFCLFLLTVVTHASWLNIMQKHCKTSFVHHDAHCSVGQAPRYYPHHRLLQHMRARLKHLKVTPVAQLSKKPSIGCGCG